MTANRFRILYIPALFALILIWSSCRKDFEYENSTGNLTFSRDTVYLDTVFTNIGSSSYSLKVYNRSNKDLQIPSISLENGLESFYRINVDGQAGLDFVNVPLAAKDSLYIFIETTIDISTSNKSEFLYEDALRFDTGIHEQKIPLITLVKDAIFLYPSQNNLVNLTLETNDTGEQINVTGFELSDEQLNFTNEKAYVVYGYATVPKNKTLTIAEGSRVYFHKNSGLYVPENSSLHVEGLKSKDTIALENEVIFEGDRLEQEYSYTAGQWGTIWLGAGSIAHTINHLTIKNATIGLVVNGNKPEGNSKNLSLKNSQIYNSATINLWSRGASIDAENTVIANSGSTSVAISGGVINFTHTTIANYWANGSRFGYALQISNNLEESTEANFGNCIIDGNRTTELALMNFNTTENSLRFNFTNCMLKINTEGFADNLLYDFQNSALFTNVFFNEASSFQNPNKNILALKSTSFAIGKGNSTIANKVPLDLNERDRTTSPALGAYQYNFD